jgi:hypothetical protein
LELCPSCHGKYKAEQGIYEWNMKPTEVQEKFEMREKVFYINYPHRKIVKVFLKHKKRQQRYVVILTMRLAALIGVIIIVLIILATAWYSIQQLFQNNSERQQHELMVRGCTPVDYDAQGSPTAWSCPSE